MSYDTNTISKTSRRDRFNSIEFKIYLNANQVCVDKSFILNSGSSFRLNLLIIQNFSLFFLFPSISYKRTFFYQCEYSRLGQFAIPYLNELSSIWLYEKIRDAIFFYAPYYTVHSRNICFRKKIIMCIHT